MNYFAEGVDAERYARARPNIHPVAIEKFRALAGIDEPVATALDVGCGTGQSALALVGTARRIVGVDPSSEMLEHALEHPDVHYAKASAEKMPFGDGEFDIITVAQAYHWFDHGAFLSEASRLLRTDGWLLIYTSWFTGEMVGEPGFSAWFNDEYLDRYPTPPRDRTPVTKGLTQAHGLLLRIEEEFANEIAMSVDRFTDYQLSTTNVIAAIERGEGSFDAAARWIKAGLEPHFEGTRERGFLFSGTMWGLQKTTRAQA